MRTATRRGPRSLRTPAGAVVALAVLVLAVAAVLTPAGPTGAVVTQDEDLADPDMGTDQARRRAEEILDDEAYQGPDRTQSPLERFQEWLSDQLEGRLDIGEGTSTALSWVVIVLFAGAALAGVILGVISLRRSRRGRRADTGDDGGAEIEVTPLRSAADWAMVADARAADGDWPEAVRARYRHLTTTLVDRGVLADLPGRTPGEDRATVADVLAPAAPLLDDVSRTYERVWFGRHDASAADDEALRAASERIIALAPRRPQANADAEPAQGADRQGSGDGQVAVRSLDEETPSARSGR